MGKDLEHELLALANREAADRIAVEVHGGERFGGLHAKLWIVLPCTMPNNARPAWPCSRNAASERSAQRRESCIELRASANVAGKGVHSSNCI